MLKTIETLWNLPPLTARDKAAPGLGDVLTLAQPRKDDPIQGVKAPVATLAHPNSSRPSLLQTIHAWRLAALPMRNDKGSYDKHTPPDLSSSAAISDYIETRTAAWDEHLRRRAARRAAR